MQRDGVLVRFIGERDARERSVAWWRGGRCDAVLVHVRHHGVVLRENGEDNRCRAGGHVVEYACSQRSQDDHDDGRYRGCQKERNQNKRLVHHISCIPATPKLSIILFFHSRHVQRIFSVPTSFQQCAGCTTTLRQIAPLSSLCSRAGRQGASRTDGSAICGCR